FVAEVVQRLPGRRRLLGPYHANLISRPDQLGGHRGAAPADRRSAQRRTEDHELHPSNLSMVFGHEIPKSSHAAFAARPSRAAWSRLPAISLMARPRASGVGSVTHPVSRWRASPRIPPLSSVVRSAFEAVAASIAT